MAAGDDNSKGKEGKGFAGLSSLVSDVDTTHSPVPEKSPTGAASAAPGAGRPAPQKTPPVSKQPTPATSEPTSGSSAGMWLLVIAAAIGVLWVFGASNKRPSPPVPAFTTTTPSVPGSQAQAPSPLDEAKPPIGQNLVFSMAQIRYCLAEDIRMESAKSALNNYSDADVDRFNAMVSEYNGRCGSFRYRSGALESARRDVEPFRSQLQTEGRNRFVSSPSSGSLSDPAPSRLAPDATVQAIQLKLNELGYDAGTPDGLMGSGTRSAIIAFQQARGLIADGLPNTSLLRQLELGVVEEANASTSARMPTKPNPVSNGLPANASLDFLGNDWECNRGFYKMGNKCRQVQIPPNANLDYLGHDWECIRGFHKAGNECRQVQIPPNANLDYLGHDWECIRGFYRTGSECRQVQIPPNASLDYLGHDWDCNRGFRRAGSKCEQL